MTAHAFDESRFEIVEEPSKAVFDSSAYELVDAANESKFDQSLYEKVDSSYKFDELGPVGKTLDVVGGVVEIIPALYGGFVASAPAAVVGAFNAFFGKDGTAGERYMSGYRGAHEFIAKTIPYRPETATGKSIEEAIGEVFEFLPGKAGEKTFEITGRPGLATAAKTAVSAAELALPFLIGRKKSDVPKESEGEPVSVKPVERPDVFDTSTFEVVKPTGDLFGGKNASQQAILDANLARQKRIDESPPVESGEGDLFSGRAKQVDIQDAIKTRKTAAVKDDPELLKVIADMGGLSRTEAKAQGIDPAYFKEAKYYRLFPKNKGMTFDQAAEALAERGYQVLNTEGRYDPNVLLEKLSDSLSGKKIYSQRGAPAEFERQAKEYEEYKEYVDRQQRNDIKNDDLLNKREAAAEREAIMAETPVDIAAARQEAIKTAEGLFREAPKTGTTLYSGLPVEEIGASI